MCEVGSRRPYWGEPELTRKVVGKYVRRIQQDLKKAFSVYFPDKNQSFKSEGEFLLEQSIQDATKAGRKVLRQAEESWQEKQLTAKYANQETVTSRPGTGSRRGYRPEVREWMKCKKLGTLEEARRKLGISLSTLKSIMSDKGKRRYSEDTLESVLEKIGCKKP